MPGPERDRGRSERGRPPPTRGRSCASGRDRSRRAPPARKALGQHFLVSDRAAGTIAKALGEIAGRSVLEIGPGRGILTAALLECGARVIGLELDERLVGYLRERFGARAGAQLEVVHGDVLATDLSRLARERGIALPLLVAGNIPYAITSPLLRRLLAVPGEVERAVLMLQREVAERLLADPGSGAYGSLTVGVRAVAEVTAVRTLSPAKFQPRPAVWSTVVRIDPRLEALPAARRTALERLTKTIFAGRRKQLQKVLRQEELVRPEELAELERQLGIPLSARPEKLPVEGFVHLLDFLEGRATQAK